MKLSGTSRLSADRHAVFAALNDPSVLVRAIPGCRQLEALGEDAYKMTVAAGVGSIKGVYDGQVRLTDVLHPESFVLHAQGAGAPGTIGAEVLITLTEHADGGTELAYVADAVVGGMIGGVGQRMLSGVSKKMAAEFFANVDNVLTGAVPARPGAVPAEALGGDGAGIQPPSFVGRRPGPSTPAPPPPTASSGPVPGQVFTAPARAADEQRFTAGVAAGAVAALAGALVGGWIASRRRG